MTSVTVNIGRKPYELSEPVFATQKRIYPHVAKMNALARKALREREAAYQRWLTAMGDKAQGREPTDLELLSLCDPDELPSPVEVQGHAVSVVAHCLAQDHDEFRPPADVRGDEARVLWIVDKVEAVILASECNGLEQTVRQIMELSGFERAQEGAESGETLTATSTGSSPS